MPSNKCCISGCETKKNVKTHVFPENEEDFKVWVQRTGNQYIETMKKECIRKSYRICHLHFEKSCESPGTNKLKYRSLPSLNLPCKNTVLHDDCLHDLCL